MWRFSQDSRTAPAQKLINGCRDQKIRKIILQVDQKLIKRLVDFSMATAALLTLSPLLIAIATIIYATMGRPVFFRQRRPGLNGKKFWIFKFRTMDNHRDAQGKLLPDGERLTTLGQWLRSTSTDELPELWNVLNGDMSIVGPRPLLVQYLDRYTPEQARRHEVKPGITGWAQINGRNAITWEEKFKLDVWYVDNRSIGIDIKIILMTVAKVLRREGITADGEATMTEFWGK